MIEPWKQKLKSRKFLLTLGVVVLTVLNTSLDLGLDEASVASIAGSVAAWVLGETALDRQRISAEQITRFNGLQREAQEVVGGLQEELAAAQQFIQRLVGEQAAPADVAEAVVAAAEENASD